MNADLTENTADENDSRGTVQVSGHAFDHPETALSLTHAFANGGDRAVQVEHDRREREADLEYRAAFEPDPDGDKIVWQTLPISRQIPRP